MNKNENKNLKRAIAQLQNLIFGGLSHLDIELASQIFGNIGYLQSIICLLYLIKPINKFTRNVLRKVQAMKWPKAAYHKSTRT